MKSRDLQPRLPYPAKLSFRIKGQKKSFPDEKKQKECIITKQFLYENLKGLIKEKENQNCKQLMTINTYPSTTEPKKLSKQEEQRQNHGYGERFDGCLVRGGYGGKGEDVR